MKKVFYMNGPVKQKTCSQRNRPVKQKTCFAIEASYIKRILSELFGGDKRDRTADLLNAIQALSQLSYTPMYVKEAH